MAFCMVYLLYQLQEVIFYDGKTKRTNPEGRYTDCVDELIFKIVNAHTKKIIIKYV